MEKPQKFVSSQIQLLALMYFAYAVSMIMKYSIIVVSPSLISDPLVAMSKTQFGEILASGSIGGIFGKILFGLGADRFGGKKSFLVSLLILSIGIILFGFSYNIFAFNLIFFSLALSKAGGWPSLANLTGHWYHSSQFGRVWGYISTSSRCGTIVATLGLGFLLNYLPWRSVLYVSASIGILMVIIWYFCVPEKPDKIQQDDQPKRQDSQRYIGHPLYNKTLKFALFDFLKSKRVCLIFFAMMGLTIMVDFLNFVPIFIKETLDISDANAVLIASAFPIGSVVSVLAGGYVFDALPAKTITKVIGFLLGIAVLCIVVIYNLSYFSFSLQMNILVIYICLFGFGLSVAPAYYLPMSIFSIKYGGPFSGILISILDIGGFFASAIFGIIIGRVADSMGWGQVLLLLMLMGIITLMLTVWFLHNESKVADGGNFGGI
jgi:sugar phosphate permease